MLVNGQVLDRGHGSKYSSYGSRLPLHKSKVVFSKEQTSLEAINLGFLNTISKLSCKPTLLRKSTANSGDDGGQNECDGDDGSHRHDDETRHHHETHLQRDLLREA